NPGLLRRCKPVALTGSISLTLRAGRFSLWMQKQFLNAPIGSLSNVQFVFRRARKLMRAGKGSEQTSGTADHSKHLSVERDFKDPTRVRGFADVQHLIRSRSNTNKIRRADHSGESRSGWSRAVDGATFRIRRHVDCEHP